jgi:membrane-bound lytic murein transglycosylase D
MDTKNTTYTYFMVLSLLWLASCNSISQQVHQVTDPKALSQSFDSLITEDEWLPGEADGDKIRPVDTYRAANLDSAANNLFYIEMDTSSDNPYGFEPDELVAYPDSVYQERINNISTALPLDFNEHVKDFIDLYALRKRDLTERMFGRSILYFPYIETVLAEMQLPHKLKYLTMVESAMNADASSHMQAVGLWQIRYRTGRWLGLKIDDYVDERRDPYASTHAALDYLQRLYDMYGSWPMALAAYNSGPGNVNKAIMRAGGSRGFWRIRPYLPAETRSYVPAFMALVYLFEYQDEHNIHPIVRDVSFRAVDTVRIFKQVSFASLSEDTGIEEEELSFLNPALIRQVVPESKTGYPLVIPLSKVAAFEEYRVDLLQNELRQEVAQTAQVLQEKKELVPDKENWQLREYRVRSGNTIGSIARRFGCDVSEIKAWNGKRSNIVRVGETLKIYVPRESNGR